MVFAKGTFDLVDDGECTLAATQALITGPLHWDDDPNLSLRFDSDFAIFKPKAECYFVGHAWAPGAEPVGSLLAGFKVGAVTRNIAVFGDRFFDRYGAVSTPTPFTQMPLRWERAFGGPGFSRNPLGAGLREQETEQGPRVMLPNLEDPSTPISSPGDRPAPVCFAPVMPNWVERTRKTGTYDDAWLKTRWPWLPVDFDYSYYNSAPAAQSVDGAWRGDESLGLQHLTPSRSVLKTRLPGLRARCFAEVERPSGAVEFVEVVFRLDTIVLDGDNAQCQLVWRGLLEGVTEKLEEVKTLFFIHEPLSAVNNLGYYQQWLERKKAEETDEDAEFEPEAPPEDNALPAPAAVPSYQEALASLALSLEASADASSETREGSLAIVERLREMIAQPEAPSPSAEEAVASMEAAGIEVPPELRASLHEAPEAAPDEDLAEAAALTREEVLRRRAYEEPMVGLDLAGVDLSNLDLSGVDFSDAVLTRTLLRGALLRGCTFKGADLSGADLTEADIAECDFTESVLDGVSAAGVDAQEADFADASAEDAVFTGSRFFKANLKGAEFVGASIDACDFRESILDGCDFSHAKGARSHFERASMVDATLEAGYFSGAIFDGANLTGLRAAEKTNLENVSMLDVVAVGAKFEEANLRGLKANRGVFEKAEFARAVLEAADLTCAKLREARFHEAILTGASLLTADAMEANFESANLEACDLRGCNLTASMLWRARLRGAQLELALLHRSTLAAQSESP